MEYTVAAVDEALGLLTLVAEQPGLGVTELARRSGNTKARTFRLLSTLEQRGFVQRQGDAALYRLGHQALLLGMAAREQVNLVNQADKIIIELGERLNENVGLRVRDGLHTVCVARWVSSHELRVRNDIGMPRPLHVGASGKVLLAFGSDEIRQLVLGGELERFTPNTIVQRSKLSQELSRVKAQGYAISAGEYAADVLAVAAPVWESDGSLAASIGISVPVSRAPVERRQALIDAVTEAAASLSRELGYRAKVSNAA